MLFSKKAQLSVQGMSCSHCEQTVVKGVSEMPGVRKVKANHSTGTVEVYYKEDLFDQAAVREKIKALGYEVA